MNTQSMFLKSEKNGSFESTWLVGKHPGRQLWAEPSQLDGPRGDYLAKQSLQTCQKHLSTSNTKEACRSKHQPHSRTDQSDGVITCTHHC